MQEAQIQEDPSEKEMVIHSSIVAWEIPWTEESGSPQYMELQKSLLKVTKPPKQTKNSYCSQLRCLRQRCLPNSPIQQRGKWGTKRVTQNSPHPKVSDSSSSRWSNLGMFSSCNIIRMKVMWLIGLKTYFQSISIKVKKNRYRKVALKTENTPSEI